MSAPTLPFEATDDLLVAVVRVAGERKHPPLHVHDVARFVPWPTVSVTAERSVTLGGEFLVEYRDCRFWYDGISVSTAVKASNRWSDDSDEDSDVVKLLALKSAQPTTRRITDDEALVLLGLARAKWPEAGI